MQESEVLRRLGYRKAGPPQARLRGALQQAIGLGKQIVLPRAIYGWYKIRATDAASLLLEIGARFHIGKGLKLWAGAEYLAVALCTIGPELEGRVAALFKQGEPLLASMLDAAGTAAADSLEIQLHQRLCLQAHANGMSTGPRLAPGSEHWPLEEQRLIFDLLPADRIGVSLNEHCMMLPRKSVSFCCGAGKSESWRGLDSEKVSNACQLCPLTGCPQRKIEQASNP